MDDIYIGNTDYITYGDMTFLRRCPECKRFVKADKILKYEKNGLGEIRITETNATCKKHGRINMEFIGYF